MGHKTTRRSLAALCALPLALLVFPALGDTAPEMTGASRLAIGGYDTVAYFTVGKAVPGRLEYQTVWHGSRPLAVRQPGKSRPLCQKSQEIRLLRTDGHCAMGVAYEGGHKDTVDPEAFTIVNGKLYLNHTKYWTIEWRKNQRCEHQSGRQELGYGEGNARTEK